MLSYDISKSCDWGSLLSANRASFLEALASINHDLRIASLDAPPIIDAKTDRAIPFIHPLAVTSSDMT
jgi:hypothetical protein